MSDGNQNNSSGGILSSSRRPEVESSVIITIGEIVWGEDNIYEDTPLSKLMVRGGNTFVKITYEIGIGDFRQRMQSRGEGRDIESAIRRCTHEIFYHISRFEKSGNKKPFVPEFIYKIPKDQAEALKLFIDEKLAKYKVNEALSNSTTIQKPESIFDMNVHTVFNMP